MTIGERIREKRKKKEYTLEQLADEIGVTKSTILKYENGSIAIPSDKIEKIAKSLDTSPVYLMGWEEEKKFRNRYVHNVDISTDDKLNFIKKIAKHINSGMTYEEIAQILDFPKDLLYRLIFEEDLITLAKTNKDIFKLLIDSVEAITKKVFADSNLTFTDEDAEISKETFNQIINDMNTSQILENELKKYKKTEMKSNVTIIDPDKFISVPVYGKASAGCGYINMDEVKFYKTIHINGYSHNSFLIEVSGNSMEPLINDGEFVLVDPSNIEITNGKVYVVTYNDETFIKRIEKYEEIIILKSINPLYNDKLIQGEQLNFLKIEGRVVKVISEKNL